MKVLIDTNAVNVQDFSSGSIPVVTPEQFIQAITEDDENE